MGLENRNTLVFDELALDERIRDILTTLLLSDECYNIFNADVDLKPLDSDIRPDSYFPCVRLSIFNQGIDTTTSDNLQIQNRTRFTVQIDTFTSGATKKFDNIKLAKLIEQTLQHDLGLRFLQNEEINSEVDFVSRRQLRATNVIDNAKGIIYNY